MLMETGRQAGRKREGGESVVDLDGLLLVAVARTLGRLVDVVDAQPRPGLHVVVPCRRIYKF